MITQMNLPQQVPFTEPSKLEKMDKVCYVFGPNGSGKTSISRLIRNESDKQSSSVLERNGSPDVKAYVYNKDFVSENFSNSAKIPGVFTLGSENVDAKKKIQELEDKIYKENQDLARARKNLENAQEEFDRCENAIVDICWKIKSGLPDILRHNWHGTGNNKKKFKEDVFGKMEGLPQSIELPNVNMLKDKAKIIFDNTIGIVDPLPLYSYKDLLICEDAPIFAKSIVGKENVGIGELIKKLGNSDWVAQGRRYVTDDICPFCQHHSVDEELKSDLEKFFDESYRKDVLALKRAAGNYENNLTRLIKEADAVGGSYEEFLDFAEFKVNIANLKSMVQISLEKIKEKIAEPSKTIAIQSVGEICAEIARLVKVASDRVNEHNALVEHRKDERNKLWDDLMLYVAMNVKRDSVNLRQQERDIRKKIDGLTKTINSDEARIRSYTESRDNEENRLTDIRDAAEQINTILYRFGFSNFKVSVTQDGESYQIVRNDGTIVDGTLSEGETSFLTFLYFYYLMNGSLNRTGINEPRIVVLDDPISSLDADVLFVVSSLVRELAQEARSQVSDIEQLIVLTHNITFHREITYIRPNEGNPHTSYYLIRKVRGHSVVERCFENPVSSTYEMLWKDLFREDCNALTAQNESRRIIETFFKLVGMPDLDNIIAEMESPEREIARSLMSWANAGSHSAFDDETFVNTGETTENYRKALRIIFEKANYGLHYDKMVKISTCSENSEDNVPEVGA